MKFLLSLVFLCTLALGCTDTPSDPSQDKQRVMAPFGKNGSCRPCALADSVVVLNDSPLPVRILTCRTSHVVDRGSRIVFPCDVSAQLANPEDFFGPPPCFWLTDTLVNDQWVWHITYRF